MQANTTEKLLNFICTFSCACFVIWFVHFAVLWSGVLLPSYSAQLLVSHILSFVGSFARSFITSLHFFNYKTIFFSSYFHLILAHYCDPSYTCSPGIGMAADTYIHTYTYLYTFNTCVYTDVGCAQTRFYFSLSLYFHFIPSISIFISFSFIAPSLFFPSVALSSLKNKPLTFCEKFKITEKTL